MDKPIPIYVDGKAIGEVRGNVFTKRIYASRHFLRRPPAIAFDIDSLHAAQRAGAVFVQVLDGDSNRTYIQRIETILEKGLAVNRGFGKQIALPLKLWKDSVEALSNEPTDPTETTKVASNIPEMIAIF
jgi:hypothetical protein